MGESSIMPEILSGQLKGSLAKSHISAIKLQWTYDDPMGVFKAKGWEIPTDLEQSLGKGGVWGGEGPQKGCLPYKTAVFSRGGD